ncbi:MAG: hypothetical protein VW268_05340 [Rhodospirillaceae bacterium]
MKRRDAWVLTLAGVGTAAVMLVFSDLWAVPWLIQLHDFTRAEAVAAVSLNVIARGIGAAALAVVAGLAMPKDPVPGRSAVDGPPSTM